MAVVPAEMTSLPLPGGDFVEPSHLVELDEAIDNRALHLGELAGHLMLIAPLALIVSCSSASPAHASRALNLQLRVVRSSRESGR